SGGGSSSGPVVVSRSPALPVGTAQRLASRSSLRVTQQGMSGTREFRPSLKVKDIETANIDPTLHLPLLEKLRTVGVGGGTRSLFEIGAEPAEIKVKEPDKIAIAHPF